MSQPKTTPKITVVIEGATRQVSEKISIERGLSLAVAQAKDFPPGDVEFLFVSGEPLDEEALVRQIGPMVRVISVPGAGYYTLKNAGFAAARGEIVVFWDSDCRPIDNYLKMVVERFDADPALMGLAGATVYDGEDWLTRLNTVFSFGFLHRPNATTDPECALAHNMSFRRSAFSEPPCGPYIARMGGDAWATNLLREKGTPFRVDRALRVYHESPAYSFYALLERHFRDCFASAMWKHPQTRTAAAKLAFRQARRQFRIRSKKLRDYGPSLGFNRPRQLLAYPVLAAYWALDIVILGALLVVPKYRDAIISWIYGPIDRGWIPADADRQMPADFRAAIEVKPREAVGV